MAKMSLQATVNDLNQLFLSGQLLNAVDKYYADDVVISQLGQDQRTGKDANRAFERDFMEGITTFHGARVKSAAVSETGPGSGVAMIEWFIHIDHQLWGPDVKLDRVSVQHWRDGKIEWAVASIRPN